MKSKILAPFASFLSNPPRVAGARIEEGGGDDERKQREGESDEDYAKRMEELDEKERAEQEEKERKLLRAAPKKNANEKKQSGVLLPKATTIPKTMTAMMQRPAQRVSVSAYGAPASWRTASNSAARAKRACSHSTRRCLRARRSPHSTPAPKTHRRSPVVYPACRATWR